QIKCGSVATPPPPTSQELQLLQNLPNPFQAATSIGFDLPRDDHVLLRVFDPAGRLVRVLLKGRMPAGHHEVDWDAVDGFGSTLGAGIYLCELKASGAIRVRRMILIP